jgi:hypothetical protein
MQTKFYSENLDGKVQLGREMQMAGRMVGHKEADGVHLAQDSGLWRAFVNCAMKGRLPPKQGIA